MTTTASDRTPHSFSTWPVLHLAGEVDIAAVPGLRHWFRLAAAADRRREVVVDLSEVTFMDCAALGALIGAQSHLGGRLWLRGLPRSVRRLLQLTDHQTSFAVLDPGEPTVPERGAHGSASTYAAVALHGRAGDAGRAGQDADAPRPPGPRRAPAPEATGWSTFPDAARAAVRHLNQLFPVDLWLVTRVDETGQVAVASQGGWSPRVPAGRAMPWIGSFGLHMVAGLAPAVAPRTRDVPLYAAAAAGEWEQVCGFVGVPLLRADDLVGTLCGFSGRPDAPEVVESTTTVRLLGRMLSTILTSQHAAAADRDEPADAARQAGADLLGAPGQARAGPAAPEPLLSTPGGP